LSGDGRGDAGTPEAHRDRALRSAAAAASRLAAVRVLDDLGLLQGDESAVSHRLDQRVDLRQRGEDLLLAVDDLDHDGEVLGQAEYLGGMDAAARAVALDSPHHRGPGQPEAPRLLDDDLVQRAAMMLVRFSEEDPQQLALAGDLHGRALLTRVA